ncbi:MAG: phosphomannomutase/phosphoglucomutase [Alphaproteobacteria bacterium]|nr:phosphomannomutase/phosphoglucomutase [Alphaproteobacteria bacterium]
MSSPHPFNPTILREYDIRGIVGTTLFEADALAIGQTFGTMVVRRGGNMVCVGYDGRLSSPLLEAALVRGLVATGLEVRRVGRGPTPMLYFAAHLLEADGAIMVTGSHNPPDHNGFKIVLGGKPFFAGQIRELGLLAAQGGLEERDGGKAVDEPVAAGYLDRLLADYDGDGGGGRPLTVVWDSGNGATGDIVQTLIQRLPGRHVLLNGTIDGTFPAHHPDPTEPENLRQLIAAVTAEGADLGIAFDGDGDRIGVVDQTGRILYGDQILMFLAEEVLATHPGAPILADVKASQSLFDHIARLGGQPVMCRTGHSIIKTQLAELKAPLAGEMSGHIFFADRYYGFDDALYAAIRFLGMVARWQGPTLAERVAALPRVWNTPELRIDCAEDRKFAIVAAVRDRLAATDFQVTTIDGVRVATPDGWWLLRASNTQAILVARCEANSEAGLVRLQAILQHELAGFGLSLPG